MYLYDYPVISEDDQHDSVDAELYTCRHIYELEVDEPGICWVDGYNNLVLNERDYESVAHYPRELRFFKTCYFDILVNQMKKQINEQHD